MRQEWRLQAQIPFLLEGSAPEWEVSRVLLEYEGPYLVILADRRGSYLALAADQDDVAVRWIVAPISHLEYEALVTGGTSVRAVLTKDRVFVIDYQHETQRRVAFWEVSSQQLPDELLPEPGALLPTAARRHLLQDVENLLMLPSEQPSFDLGGKPHILFGDLAAVASQIQALWNTFAQTLNRPFANLAAEAVSTGSLRLQVYTDDLPLFGQIATRYRELTFASDDLERLDRVLSLEPPSVGAAYRSYLRAVSAHEVEVLARWQGEAAFIGFRQAARAEARIRSAALLEAKVAVERPLNVRGYFEGFLPSGRSKFEFYDIDTGATYIGTVDKRLRRRFKEELQSLTIIGGLLSGRRSQMYRAMLRASLGDEKPRYILEDFEPLPPDPTLIP